MAGGPVVVTAGVSGAWNAGVVLSFLAVSANGTRDQIR